MISSEERRILHRFIVVDLMCRTLLRDCHFVHYFKMERVFTVWFEKQQHALQQELTSLKVLLKRKGIAVFDMQIIDEYFCKFKVATRGEDMELHYSRHALKSDVEEEVRQRLMLK